MSGSVEIDPQGQPRAKSASHGAPDAGATAPTAVTPAAARASLELALAAALTRATEASGTHAGAWDTMREVARAVQVALATAAPSTPTTHEVVELEAARKRRQR